MSLDKLQTTDSTTLVRNMLTVLEGKKTLATASQECAH